MTPEKQKKRNWLAIGWEFAFMNDRPCIIIAEHRLGKSNILLSSYEKEGAIEIKGYLKATDVVPKNEVDKILDEFIRLMIDNFGVNPYDRMNFDVRDLVELKKKYIGVENDG